MPRRVRVGMLTPSSNTALEPVTTAMLRDVPEVSVHFSRFRVTEIALSRRALDQFDHSEILRAAELLADAKVDVIAWNGTSASWLGFDADESLCERIAGATGIAACTSVLALREVFQRTAVRRFGLVTPYLSDVQARIVETFSASGLACCAERHSGLRDNFSFAEISEESIAEMVRAVAREGCQAVAVVCTNMHGAGVAERLERELDVPIYDSIAVTLWKCLDVAGVSPASIDRWGRVFRDRRLRAETTDEDPAAAIPAAWTEPGPAESA